MIVLEATDWSEVSHITVVFIKNLIRIDDDRFLFQQNRYIFSTTSINFFSSKNMAYLQNKNLIFFKKIKYRLILVL